jgi:CRISPR/Cas system-associated exonuclease Cas4 (RecB family)
MCKPDVLQEKRLIEYKSSHCYGKPFLGDLLQLTGEMMATGAREAELRYGNGRAFTYSINDPIIQENKAKVIAIIAEMRMSIATGRCPHGLPAAKKCARCVFTLECDFSLAA